MHRVSQRVVICVIIDNSTQQKHVSGIRMAGAIMSLSVESHTC
jgi:hypothetical protein